MISKVGLAIHNKPWLIEPQTALNLLALWEQMLEGKSGLWQEQQQTEQDRLAEFRKLFAGNGSAVFAPTNSYDAKLFKGFDGARQAVIPVQGPLMKSDFCGDFGTSSLQNLFRLAENTPSVESIVLLIDSPGGTVDGTESFANTVRNSTKHTTAVVDGYMCSAAYWIGSAASEVFASNKTDVIGSIGTMVAFRDNTKYMEQNGILLREFYATKSTDKNRAFNEAKNGDGRMLVQEMLDPTNNEFVSAVKSARSGKINLENEDVLTGKTYLGTKAKSAGLIDAVLPFDKALQQSLRSAQQKQKIKMESNTPFKKTLTAAKAELFEVVEGGFLLSEENLRNIEENITENEMAVRQAQATVAAADTARDNAITAQQTAEQNLATANETIDANDQEISRLNARIAQLEKGTEEPKQTKAEADKTGNGNAAYHLSNEDPANKLADSLFGAPAEKK